MEADEVDVGILSIELGDVWGDLNLDYDVTIGVPNHLIIQIEKDISPIQAAEYLYVGLQRALGYHLVRNEIPPDDFDTLKAAYKAQAAEAGRVAGAAANLYLNGISIVNEGADWVMTINDLSDGQYIAAIGFLPFLSGRIADAQGLVIKRLGDAGILNNFDNAALDAIAEAASKTDFDEQFAILEANLDVAQRTALVKARLLKSTIGSVSRAFDGR